jgi:uncharacterized membrane protein YbhN (UPF0104 family)
MLKPGSKAESAAPSKVGAGEQGRTLKSWLRHLPALLGVALLFGAIYVVQREFRHLRLDDVIAALRGIPHRSLVTAAVWTFLAYGVLTFYDRLGSIYAGRKVSYRRSAFASFCAYALSHNLGFAAVSGAAVRYRLYSQWGLAPVQIAKVVAFCSLTFGLGGMVLGGTILLAEPNAVPFFGTELPRAALAAVALCLFAVVGAYMTLSSVVGTVRLFGYEVVLPGWRMALLQVGLATADVAVTAAILYTLLPPVHGLTYVRFLAVYLACYSAGLATNLPGGLGVFDSAMLLGLSPYLDPPRILGAVVVFRLFYYIIPLFLAGSLFTGNEILVRGQSLRRGGAFFGVASPLTRAGEADFAIAALAGIVALCGALLLSLGVLAPHPDFSWIDPDFAGVADSAGQFVPSLIGAGLLVLAVGMSQRVTLAWGATIVLLLCAAAFAVAQGQYPWIAAVLVLAAVLLAPFRSAFYRHASLLSGPLQAATALPLFTLIGCVLALAGFERHVHRMVENSWWEIVLSRDVPNSLRATVLVTVLLLLLATWRLIRPGRVTFSAWQRDSQLRYASFGAVPPAAADGVVWGEAERSGIPFRRLAGVLLGLGDPAGADSDRISAIWRLRDLAQQEGRRPAFWRTGPELLKVYGDLGLTALPIGADGLPFGDAVPEHLLRAVCGTRASGETLAMPQFLCCMVERDFAHLAPVLASLPGVDAPAADLGRVVAMPLNRPKRPRPGDAAA